MFTYPVVRNKHNAWKLLVNLFNIGKRVLILLTSLRA